MMYRRDLPGSLAASINFTAPPQSTVHLRSGPLPGPAPAAKTTASTPPQPALGELRLGGLLEVAEHGSSAGLPHVLLPIVGRCG